MDKQVMKTMMGSGRRDQGTPQELFDKVDGIFHFNLDVCALRENAKVDLYMSPEEDALNIMWSGFMETRGCGGDLIGWCNPPYGKPENPCVVPHEKCKRKACRDRGWHRTEYLPGIHDWVKKVIKEKRSALSSRYTVVMLLPGRTDTAWFQSVWSEFSVLCFLRGRYKFEGQTAGAPFPSVLAVISNRGVTRDEMLQFSKLGNSVDLQQYTHRGFYNYQK